MTDEKKKVDVKETADSIIRETKAKSNNSQFVLWFAALILGAVLGWMGIPALNEFFNFVATVFTRLFQFIAVPTIALAVITTLAALGGNKETGIIFAHAVVYTLLTTFLAAFIGLGLYLYIAPDNLPAEIVNAGSDVVKGQSVAALSYYDHTTMTTFSALFLTTYWLRSFPATYFPLCLSLLPLVWHWLSCRKPKTAKHSLKSFKAFRNWHSPLSVLFFTFCRLVSLLSQASFPHRLKQA